MDKAQVLSREAAQAQMLVMTACMVVAVHQRSRVSGVV